MAEFSPLMLTIARESRKLSQSGLAGLAEVSQSALSQFEAGTRSPTDDVVHRLARALRYPASIFSVSLRFQQLPMTFFRKKSRVSVRDVNAIRARVNLYRLRLEILMRSADIEDARVTLTHLEKEGLSPEDAANRLRTYWNVPPGPIKDLTSLAESHGIVVVPFDFETAQVDALSIYEPNDTLPPMVFINTNVPPDRYRMTLGHEIAHIVLHHHLSIPAETKDMEIEAFAFASEFLMPGKEVNASLRFLTMHRLAALKKHWGISMAAILRRAYQKGLVTDRAYRGLNIHLRRGPEEVEVARESPSIVSRLVERHLGDLRFTSQSLGQVLHSTPEEFRTDFGPAAGRLRLA